MIAEQFQFCWFSQQDSELVAEFMEDLRQLAINCEFGEFLNEALRDRYGFWNEE